MFTPDRKSVVTWQADTVTIWDRTTGFIITTLRGSQDGVFGGGVSSVDLSEGGDILAEGSNDGAVRIYRFPRAPSARAEWNKPWQNNECGVRDRGDARKGVTLDSYATWFPSDGEASEDLRQIISGRGYCWQIISWMVDITYGVKQSTTARLV
jgi:WD40 repeat protein